MNPRDSHKENAPSDNDARLIRGIQEGYAAPELTPARRAAIEARVWQRIERRPRLRLLVSVGASAALAAGLVIFIGAPNPATESRNGAATVASSNAYSVNDSAWADALLFDPAAESNSQDRFDELPDDYRAITDVLLEG